MACAQYLSRMWPGRMQTRVKGCRGSAQCFHAQGRGGLRGVKEILQLFQSQTADGQHRLGSVQERNALFAQEHEWLQSCTFETNCGGKYAALILRVSLADQYERHVSKRSEIAARSDTAARRNDRSDLMVQQIADTFCNDRAYAGETLRQNIGADQHHAAHNGGRQWRADSAAVRSNQVDLHRFDLVFVETNVGEKTYAGVESVDRGRAAHCSVHPAA